MASLDDIPIDDKADSLAMACQTLLNYKPRPWHFSSAVKPHWCDELLEIERREREEQFKREKYGEPIMYPNFLVGDHVHLKLGSMSYEILAFDGDHAHVRGKNRAERKPHISEIRCHAIGFRRPQAETRFMAGDKIQWTLEPFDIKSDWGQCVTVEQGDYLNVINIDPASNTMRLEARLKGARISFSSGVMAPGWTLAERKVIRKADLSKTADKTVMTIQDSKTGEVKHVGDLKPTDTLKLQFNPAGLQRISADPGYPQFIPIEAVRGMTDLPLIDAPKGMTIATQQVVANELGGVHEPKQYPWTVGQKAVCIATQCGEKLELNKEYTIKNFDDCTVQFEETGPAYLFHKAQFVTIPPTSKVRGTPIIEEAIKQAKIEQKPACACCTMFSHGFTKLEQMMKLKPEEYTRHEDPCEYTHLEHGLPPLSKKLLREQEKRKLVSAEMQRVTALYAQHMDIAEIYQKEMGHVKPANLDKEMKEKYARALNGPEGCNGSMDELSLRAESFVESECLHRQLAAEVWSQPKADPIDLGLLS